MLNKFLAFLICVNGLLSFSQSNLFIENNGQIVNQDGNSRKDVKFYLRHPAGNLFITEKGFSIQFEKYIDSNNVSVSRIDYTIEDFDPIVFEGQNEQICQENFFSNQVNLSASSFKEVIVSNENRSISLHFYVTSEGFKYDIELTEDYSKNEVNILVAGANVTIEDNLVLINNGERSLKEQMPVITNKFQSNSRIVAANYAKTSNGYKILFEDFRGELIIDPVVTYGTYYGGLYSDECYDIAIDTLNNTYLVGTTNSSQNIATTGAYQQTIGLYGGFYVAKLNELGQRQWGTYYNTFYANPRRIEVDIEGNLYISGMTGSGMNLGTAGTHQTTFGGDYNDVFLAKFNGNGFPIWSTLYGGTGNDIVNKMVINDGFIYLVGSTNSPNSIATSGSFQEIKGGNGSNSDAFIAKFDTTGNLQIATYLGGYNSDNLNGLDYYDNHIYTVGAFNSFGMGTTGSYYPNKISNSDLFFAKFDSNLNRVWSSYFSGSSHIEGSHNVAVNKDKIYISAYVYANAGITSYALGNTHKTVADFGYEGCIMVFDTTGQNWLKGTFFGGEETEQISSISVLNDSTIVVSGYTTSFNGISTPNVHKSFFTFATSAYNTYADVFVAVFNDSLQQVWGSYYGGEGEEFAFSHKISPKNEIVICGRTTSQIGISTEFAHQPHNGGFLPQPDGFVVKFDADRDSIYTDIDSLLQNEICPKENLLIPVALKGTYFNDNVFQLLISDEFGSFSNSVLLESVQSSFIQSISVQIPYLIEGGNYKFKVNSTSPAVEGSETKSVLILASPYANFNYQVGINDVYFSDISIAPSSWNWDFGDGNGSISQNPTHFYSNTGQYLVELATSNGICSDTAWHEVKIDQVVGMKEMKNDVLIYPNPTIDFWSIVLPTNAYKVIISNAQGELIEETKISSLNFKSGKYESGVYWISIVDTNNELITVKKAIKL